MNIHLTLHALGGLLLLLAVALLTPIPFSLYFRDGQIGTFVGSAAITGAAGTILYRRFRSRLDVTLREGFAIVTFAWVSFALFGALPYLLSGSLVHPVDAFFESMSGFTTTGASVIRDVESNPKSLLFWRALTQWLGGMGIIVLTIAILPLLGVGGMQLFEAESAGPSADRLTPRIQDTARLLWGVYALLTLVGTALLWLGEMSFFDAICHTFTALATGGFSTRNSSMSAFGSYSQMVVALLMFLGATNFTLHYFALRGKVWKYWANEEFRFSVVLYSTLMVVLVAINWRTSEAVLINLRDSLFTAITVISTSGFATANYEQWPLLAQGLLFVAMFIGGCAGSTAGSLKQVRLLLILRFSWLQTSRLLHPRQVRLLKLDHRAVSDDVVRGVLGFTMLFLGVFILASLLLTAVGVDLITASSAVIACQSTVGPGLGDVGPFDNYANLPAFAKLVLCGSMLLGRLEISTVLVLLFASFWRK